ncbi:cupin domain-containing protein [Thiocapsa sp. N5-Cardenillas]|uniref:cupin domain-containing protein n=1 Tax=Thiocapsa sp. N5-Cardenillas TaxID=3137397 RepID=UPI0035B1EDC7
MQDDISKLRKRIIDFAARFTMRTHGQPVWSVIDVDAEHFEPVSRGVRAALCALNSADSSLTIMNVIMDPSAEMDVHEHDRQETLFVISGTLTEVLSNKVLREGDTYFIAENKQHGWLSETGCLLTVTWRPAYPRTETVHTSIKTPEKPDEPKHHN